MYEENRNENVSIRREAAKDFGNFDETLKYGIHMNTFAFESIKDKLKASLESAWISIAPRILSFLK